MGWTIFKLVDWKGTKKTILQSKALIPRALLFGRKEKLSGSAKVKGKKIIHWMQISFLSYQKEISKNGFFKMLQNLEGWV